MAPPRDVRMVGNQSKASAPRPEPSEATIGVARGEAPVTGTDTAPVAIAEVELALADLLSDARGEVVIFNDSGFRTLALHTDSEVVANGRAESHVTAGGEDVSGFNYLTFENGMVVYFPEGLDVIVAN